MPARFTKSLLGAAVAVACSAALADPADVERCRLEASAEARIACLEAALAGAAPGHAAASSDAPAPAATRPAVPAEPATRDLPPAPPETMDQVRLPLGEEGVPGAKRPVDAAPGHGTEIGAEQVKSAQQRTEELERATGMKVSRYQRVPFRRLEVHLANGQVWRQIQGDTQEVRATLRKNQTVDIEESGLGGYKLRLNEMQRTIRVRRVK